MIAATHTPFTQDDALALFRAPPARHIDVGEGAVAYRRVGQGPDVLFVHGYPVSGATFRRLLPHLVDHVTCHVIDLPGAGDSRFDRQTRISIEQHFETVRRVVDALGFERFAVVGHDSGGMIARHAVAGDPRLAAVALVDTEQSRGLNWRFRQFLAMAKLPGFAEVLAWAANVPSLRRNKFLLGDCFTDRSLLDGPFAELFLVPLRDDADRRWAADALVKSFRAEHVTGLAEVHARIDVPVQLVWADKDPFFPLAWAQEMVDEFADARLHVVEGAKLFVHEEFDVEVAAAILPTLRGAR